jgi:hypothetical protein
MSTTKQLVRRRLKEFPEDLSSFSIGQCIKLVRLALLLDAQSPELNYYLAYFYAIAGKPLQALVYIRRSLKFGFLPLRKITHSGAFKAVRELKGYSGVITRHLEENPAMSK